jgi:hypothetical protein
MGTIGSLFQLAFGSKCMSPCLLRDFDNSLWTSGPFHLVLANMLIGLVVCGIVCWCVGVLVCVLLNVITFDNILMLKMLKC